MGQIESKWKHKRDAAEFAADHEKTKRCLDSCKTKEHLNVVSRMINFLAIKYGVKDTDHSAFRLGLRELSRAWDRRMSKIECEILNPK